MDGETHVSATATIDMHDLAGRPMRVEFRERGDDVEVWIGLEKRAVVARELLYAWMVSTDQRFTAGPIGWVKVGNEIWVFAEQRLADWRAVNECLAVAHAPRGRHRGKE